MQRTTTHPMAILRGRWHRVRERNQDEGGQSMVEYAVVTALLAAAALLALGGFGDSIKAAFDAIVTKIPTT